MSLALAIACLVCAAIPALTFLRNLNLYRPPPLPQGPMGPVSVLIPARDEEATIQGAMDSVLASQDVELELVVLDDGSTDRTAAIVQAMARKDPRVRLHTAPPLPPGWCGKQHACHVLAGQARHPVMAYMDADVRLEPLGLARSLAFMRESGAALVSGFPRQQTQGFLERLLIPLIHFVLLGFLPIWRLRKRRSPAYGAGCGQWIVVDKAAYEASGGHEAFYSSLHDGIKLPRTLRRAGYHTDLFDATEVTRCRMYDSAAKVWDGLRKNAVEGMAAPATIVPITLLLLLGQVLPLPLLALGLAAGWDGQALALLAGAAVLAYLPRLLAARRFRQPWLGALLHPLGVLLLLVIQWQALALWLMGRPASWRGRGYIVPARDA